MSDISELTGALQSETAGMNMHGSTQPHEHPVSCRKPDEADAALY